MEKLYLKKADNLQKDQKAAKDIPLDDSLNRQRTTNFIMILIHFN